MGSHRTDVQALAPELLCTRSHTRAQKHTLSHTSSFTHAPAHERYWLHTRTLHGHDLIVHAHCTTILWARTAQKPSLTRTSSCTRAPCSNPFSRAHCTKPVDAYRTKTHAPAHEPYWFVYRHCKGHRLNYTRRTQCSSFSCTHARSTRAYSHVSAPHAGFYTSSVRPVHAHKYRHEFSTRSEA